MRNLEIIVIIMSRIKSLVKFIVCNAVEHLLAVLDITAVIPMDHLAHEPEIFFLLSCPPPHFFHKIKVQAVCAVQADAVNIKGIDPEINHIQKIVPYLRILKVQVHQFKAVSPGFISKTIIIRIVPAEVDSLIPSAVRRTFPVFLDILKGKKFSSRMIENSVYHYLDIQVMGFLYEFCKILVIPQSSVHHFIVSGVVSMSRRFKKRSYIDCGASQLCHMG